MVDFLPDDLTAQLQALQRAARINVVGNSGVGKSTFAKALAATKRVPYIELDELFWKADWTESTDAEFVAAVAAAVSQPAWVLDGNYARAGNGKWQRTELVVVLDLPLLLNFWQVFSRTCGRILRRERLWAGNRETFANSFLDRDSVVLFSLMHHGHNRRRYQGPEPFAEHPHLSVIYLRSRRAARACLEGLEQLSQV